MFLPDVNIYLYAMRKSSTYNALCIELIEAWVKQGQLAVFDPILLSAIRISSSKAPHNDPIPFEYAFDFINNIRVQKTVTTLVPSEAIWDRTKQLLDVVGGKKRLLSDAYFASLAIEKHCTFVTNDNDFRRFKGLKVKFLDDLV